MYFVARATDYDGTRAEDGLVAEETIAALGSFRQSGRKFILVSGRELPDLWRFSGISTCSTGRWSRRACSRIKETAEDCYTKPA